MSFFVTDFHAQKLYHTIITQIWPHFLSILVAVLEGAIHFKARGDERVLRCDGLLALGEAIQHEVGALEETCGPPDRVSLTTRFGAC